MKNMLIAFISQKGGVGKSTLTRGFATGAALAGYSVKIADLDTQQGTSSDWHRIRLDRGHESIGSVEVFGKASTAIQQAQHHDFLIVDGAARASAATLEIAQAADLVIIPTCASRDDLLPAIKLAHELQKKGVNRDQMALGLTRVSTRSEIEDARAFIAESGNRCLSGYLPEKPGYRQAQNEGLSILETRFESLNNKANELITSILSFLS